MCRYRNLSFKTERISSKMKRKLAPVREETQRTMLCSDTSMYVLVSVAAVLCYANSLNGEFVHDDIPAIVTNDDVTGVNPLSNLFLNDFWGTPMSDESSHKSYRPLTTLSFRLNHALSGLNPCWWHVCNVALHAACCALVARTCVSVARLARPFAALAALLFAVHPVHTEAVTGIVGRSDVLACVLFLSSLLVYHRPEKTKKSVWLSIVLGALSMLAKETGITVLMLNLAFDFYRCWPLVKRSLNSPKLNKRTTAFATRMSKVLFSVGLLLVLRVALLQGSLPVFSPQDNPAAFHPSFSVRLMTFSYLAAFNWWLLLCPWTLSHDWQLGSVPLVSSAWDSRNLMTLAAGLCILMLCYRCLWNMEVQKHTPLVVGVLLLVVPYIPASNLCVTVGFVVAERVLYIPSIGSVILTAYGLQLIWKSRPRARTLLVVSIATLAAAGVAKTYRRNLDWADRATLLRADLATLPHNAKLQYNFGNYLRENDELDTATKHYREALRLWPSYASAHNNLGTILSDPEEAEHHFLMAIKHNRYHVNAHYNLGKLYRKNGRLYEATLLFENCVALQPTFSQAHVELLWLKPEDQRVEVLNTLVSLEPENWEHQVLYGNWLRSQGLPTSASKRYQEALRLQLRNPDSSSTDRGDLEAVRLTALMFRELGWRSRILQLLTRWHTWRRGYRSAADLAYLREWRLRSEIRIKAQAYVRTEAQSKITTKCFDHKQLSTQEKDLKAIKKKQNSETNNIITNQASLYSEVNSCNFKLVETKRTISISTNLKAMHNKSEEDSKDNNCVDCTKRTVDSGVVKKQLTDEINFKSF